MAKIISPDGTRSYVVEPGVSVKDVKNRYPELKNTVLSAIDNNGIWRGMKDNDVISQDDVVQAVKSHDAGSN